VSGKTQGVRIEELFERPVQIFDLDGTLVDTLVDLTVALNLALYDHRLPPIGRELVRASLHGGVEASTRAALAAAGADEAHYEPLLKSYRRHYQAILGKFSKAYRGVPPVLSSLRARGVRLAICSNKPEAEARSLLARKQLGVYFDVVVGADTYATRKPDPMPLLAAIDRLGGVPSDAIFIGDSHVDVECARAASVHCVFFEGGYGECAEPVSARFSNWVEVTPDA